MDVTEYVNGLTEQGKTDKGINTRVSGGNVSEDILGISLDTIVSSDVLMYQNLTRLKDIVKNKRRADALANAIRQYYVVKNGKKFPKLHIYMQERGETSAAYIRSLLDKYR